MMPVEDNCIKENAFLNVYFVVTNCFNVSWHWTQFACSIFMCLAQRSWQILLPIFIETCVYCDVREKVTIKIERADMLFASKNWGTVLRAKLTLVGFGTDLIFCFVKRSRNWFGISTREHFHLGYGCSNIQAQHLARVCSTFRKMHWSPISN